MKEGDGKEVADGRLQKLEILESVLHQYQEPQFKIMGNILLEIQRHKMYSLRGCKNLREYVLKHHTFQWRSARRYMNAVRVMDFLSGRQKALPTSEKQVRCLALCSKEEVNAIWAKAVEIAEAQGLQITANLVKSIKIQICQEVDNKQSSRGPRPWQDEYVQLGGKRGPSGSAGDPLDNSWELAGSSSDEDGDSEQVAVCLAHCPTDLKLKWGRKRSRHHGYARTASFVPGAKAADPQTPAPDPAAPPSAVPTASLQPPTPAVHPSVPCQAQGHAAMAYPSIPLPPAGPLAMSDPPQASSAPAVAAADPGVSVPLPVPVASLGPQHLVPGAYVPGPPGVEAAAMDLISMRQGMGPPTASLAAADVVALGEGGGAGGGGGR